MSAVTAVEANRIGARAYELAGQAKDAVSRRIDRLFVGLLIFQWLVAIALALWVSPLTWVGAESSTHPHVWTALAFGLAIISVPVWLGLTRSGEPLRAYALTMGVARSDAARLNDERLKAQIRYAISHQYEDQ